MNSVLEIYDKCVILHYNKFNDFCKCYRLIHGYPHTSIRGKAISSVTVVIVMDTKIIESKDLGT